MLANGQARLALVTIDVLAVSARFADSLRQSLADTLQTIPEAILICASHTHAGPAGWQDWFPIGTPAPLNSDLAETMKERLIDAAKMALNRLTPARLAYGVGEIEGIGGDRNQAVPALDSHVTAWSFTSPDGTQPIAIVVHYACHPTVLGPQLEYSPDFPGAARLRIEAEFPGAICLYLNGAAGNISTRFYRREQSFEEVNRLGTLLGDYVLGLLEDPQHGEVSDLGATCKQIQLPFRAFSAVSHEPLPATGNASIDQTRAEGAAIEAQLEKAFRGRTVQSARLCVLQIGPWKLLGVPGEPFNELAVAIRQVSPFALVVGYANDYLGYFPTQQAIDARTYEALSSPYDARWT